MTDTRGPGTPVRVAVLDDYQGRAHSYADWASLGAGFEVVFFDHAIGRDELVGTLAGFEVLAVMRERTAFPREVLEGLPALRLLVTTGMRNASVDVEYLRSERGIVVSGTDISGHRVAGGVPSTVEVAWALILATTKRMLIEDSAIRSGRWQLDIPTNLAGATLGLAGLGNLGSAMVG
ncbi:MAG TPA: hypothetical protein VMD59_06580, partial [Acidimicrobiales bacterium]|nr:hypothetical protein [Acidimicrobiales bacterium]